MLVTEAVMAPTDDAALMLRVQGGDAQAYRELSDRHLKRTLNFAYRILGDAQEAEDVTQEAFFSVWRNAGAFKPEAMFTPWLLTITKNLCIDRLRRRKPQTEDLESTADSQRPSSMLVRKEASLAVRAAVDALPPRQRIALSLSHFEGLSNPEIAQVMETGVEAVESLLSRARRTLRERLTRKAEVGT